MGVSLLGNRSSETAKARLGLRFRACFDVSRFPAAEDQQEQRNEQQERGNQKGEHRRLKGAKTAGAGGSHRGVAQDATLGMGTHRRHRAQDCQSRKSDRPHPMKHFYPRPETHSQDKYCTTAVNPPYRYCMRICISRQLSGKKKIRIMQMQKIVGGMRIIARLSFSYFRCMK